MDKQIVRLILCFCSLLLPNNVVRAFQDNQGADGGRGHTCVESMVLCGLCVGVVAAGGAAWAAAGSAWQPRGADAAPSDIVVYDPKVDTVFGGWLQGYLPESGLIEYIIFSPP